MKPTRAALLLLAAHALAVTHPPLLRYSTYLGAASDARGGIAVDNAGFAYVSGIAASSAFPCTQAEPGLVRDRSNAFSYLLKLAPAGDSVVWSHCLAGTPGRVTISPSGALFALRTVDQTAILSRFDPSTGAIAWTKSFPGIATSDLIADRAGFLWMTGTAPDGLPGVTPTSFRNRQTTTCAAPPCTEGFILKLDSSGNVVNGTYTEVRTAARIAIDSRGAVWIGGGGFPGRPPVATVAYAAKFDANLRERLLLRTFGDAVSGRSPRPSVSAIAIDNRDFVYLAGNANVIATTPGVPFPSASITGEGVHPFLAKLDPTGNTVFVTYLRLNSGDLPLAHNAAAGQDHVAVALTRGMLIIDSAGTRVLSERHNPGYLPSYTNINAMAAGPNGRFYFAGVTRATAFFASPGAYREEFPGAPNAAVAVCIDTEAPQGPLVSSVVNAASAQPGHNTFGPDGSVAPGELVTLYGAGFQPDDGLALTIGGRPAPILFANQQQINAVVPFDLETGKPALLSLRSAGVTTTPFRLPVAPASPGLFEIEPRQILAVHHDGSLNSPANPAAPGGIVTVYLTGAGVQDLPIRSGISALLDNRQAEIQFAGQAPGLTSGILQINLRIPTGTPPGNKFLTVHIGNYPTPLARIHIR